MKITLTESRSNSKHSHIWIVCFLNNHLRDMVIAKKCMQICQTEIEQKEKHLRRDRTESVDTKRPRTYFGHEGVCRWKETAKNKIKEKKRFRNSIEKKQTENNNQHMKNTTTYAWHAAQSSMMHVMQDMAKHNNQLLHIKWSLICNKLHIDETSLSNHLVHSRLFTQQV